jgi:hypothetical protein
VWLIVTLLRSFESSANCIYLREISIIQKRGYKVVDVWYCRECHFVIRYFCLYVCNCRCNFIVAEVITCIRNLIKILILFFHRIYVTSRNVLYISKIWLYHFYTMYKSSYGNTHFIKWKTLDSEPRVNERLL